MISTLVTAPGLRPIRELSVVFTVEQNSTVSHFYSECYIVSFQALERGKSSNVWGQTSQGVNKKKANRPGANWQRCERARHHSTHPHRQLHQSHMPSISSPHWWPVSVNVQAAGHQSRETWRHESATLATRQDNKKISLEKTLLTLCVILTHTVKIPPDLSLQTFGCKSQTSCEQKKNYETWWLERGVAVTRLSKSTKLLYNGPEFPGPCRNNNPIAQKSEMVQYTTSPVSYTHLTLPTKRIV